MAALPTIPGKEAAAVLATVTAALTGGVYLYLAKTRKSNHRRNIVAASLSPSTRASGLSSPGTSTCTAVDADSGYATRDDEPSRPEGAAPMAPGSSSSRSSSSSKRMRKKIHQHSHVVTGDAATTDTFCPRDLQSPPPSPVKTPKQARTDPTSTHCPEVRDIINTELSDTIHPIPSSDGATTLSHTADTTTTTTTATTTPNTCPACGNTATTSQMANNTTTTTATTPTTPTISSSPSEWETMPTTPASSPGKWETVPRRRKARTTTKPPTDDDTTGTTTTQHRGPRGTVIGTATNAKWAGKAGPSQQR